MTMYADKALRCVSCESDFTFTAREQEFHASKGFTNEPRRCLGCRQARRAAAPQSQSGSAPRAGEGETGDERATAESGRRSYQAVCSACGGEAVLPFEPVGNRPVLCSGCYDKIRAPA
jgi:CxxC-x17-CxxC domain-containing protein